MHRSKNSGRFIGRIERGFDLLGARDQGS